MDWIQIQVTKIGLSAKGKDLSLDQDLLKNQDQGVVQETGKNLHQGQNAVDLDQVSLLCMDQIQVQV